MQFYADFKSKEFYDECLRITSETFDTKKSNSDPLFHQERVWLIWSSFLFLVVFIQRCSLLWSPLTALLLYVILKGWNCFTSTETVGLLGTGAQSGDLDFHTAPELKLGISDWSLL